MISRTCLGGGATGLSSSSGTAILAFRISLNRYPAQGKGTDMSRATIHVGQMCMSARPHLGFLTQNSLHLLTPLDFADETALERADAGVELKPEKKRRGWVARLEDVCASACVHRFRVYSTILFFLWMEGVRLVPSPILCS